MKLYISMLFAPLRDDPSNLYSMEIERRSQATKSCATGDKKSRNKQRLSSSAPGIGCENIPRHAGGDLDSVHACVATFRPERPPSRIRHLTYRGMLCGTHR